MKKLFNLLLICGLFLLGSSIYNLFMLDYISSYILGIIGSVAVGIYIIELYIIKRTWE